VEAQLNNQSHRQPSNLNCGMIEHGDSVINTRFVFAELRSSEVTTVGRLASIAIGDYQHRATAYLAQ
jgi:hypothetical protein